MKFCGAKEKKQSKKIVNPRYLFYGFLAMLFGITIARGLFGGNLLYIVITCLLLAAALLILCLTKRFKMLIVVFALFFAGCGMFYAGSALFRGESISGTHAVVGRVSDQITDYGNFWLVKIDEVYIDGQSQGNVYLSIQDYGHTLDISAGDMVAFEGNVENAKLFTLGRFNSVYYRKNCPYAASVRADDIVVTQGDDLRYDEVIRIVTRQRLHQNMSDNNAEVCYAVLFGDKSGIDDVTYSNYNLIGILHILSVSGLHVGFLVALLYFLTKKCNKYIRFCLIFAILLAYNILCGFAPSVMRASIMSIVMLLAKLSGKEYDPLSALSVAGFLILFFRPLYALDLGFLMSFFCVVGIVLLYRPLERLFYKFLPKFIAKYLAVALAANIGILPFAASMFSSFNIVAPLANLIIVPIFSLLFPLLFVLFVLSLILPFSAILFHVVDWGFEVINYIARVLSSGGALIDLRPYPIALSILFCLGLFACSRLLMVEKVWKFFICSWTILGIALGVALVGYLPPRKSSISYFFTSPAPTLYAVDKEGKSLLVCQGLDDFEFLPYANYCNITQIDYIITLDGTIDEQIVKNYSPSGVAYPDRLSVDGNSFSFEKEQALQFENFKFCYIYVDQTLVGVEFKVDNFENFFATNEYLSYNIQDQMAQRLGALDLDLCFLNRQSVTVAGAANFSSYSGAGRISLRGYGNMQIDLKQNSWTLRCLD